jgi:hypothetical protein
MTSAVEPSNKTPFQALLEPNIRLKQTKKAIRKWLRSTRNSEQILVLGDNTGWADRIARHFPGPILEGRLKIIDVDKPSLITVEKGKGSAEAITLLTMLKVVGAPNDSFVAKINARYFCNNWKFLSDRIEEKSDFAAWPSNHLDSIDSRFFVCKAGLLSQILPNVVAETDDISGKYAEMLYAKYSINIPSVKFQRFDYPPAIEGYSGTSGKKISGLGEYRTVSILVRLRLKLYKIWKN